MAQQAMNRLITNGGWPVAIPAQTANLSLSTFRPAEQARQRLFGCFAEAAAVDLFNQP
jgi:hypothetical protein